MAGWDTRTPALLKTHSRYRDAPPRPSMRVRRFPGPRVRRFPGPGPAPVWRARLLPVSVETNPSHPAIPSPVTLIQHSHGPAGLPGAKQSAETARTEIHPTEMQFRRRGAPDPRPAQFVG